MSNERLIIDDDSDDDMASEPPKNRWFSKRRLWGLLCLLVLAGFMLGFILPVVGQFWMSLPGIWLAVAEIIMLLGGFGYLKFEGIFTSLKDFWHYENCPITTSSFLIGLVLLFMLVVIVGLLYTQSEPFSWMAVGVAFAGIVFITIIPPLVYQAIVLKRIFPLTEEEKKHVSISEGVTQINNEEFSSWTLLESIKIPLGVTSIGDSAFYDCTGLTSITIPPGVTSIGDSAFYDCTGLTSITIPPGVTYIGNNAFCNCSSLKAIFVKSGYIDEILRIVDLLRGCAAFIYCINLQFIVVDTNNTDEIARIQHSLTHSFEEQIKVFSQHDFFKATVKPIAPSAFKALTEEASVLLKPEIKDAILQKMPKVIIPKVILNLIDSYTGDFFNTRLYREVVNNILRYPLQVLLSDEKQKNECQKKIVRLLTRNGLFKSNPANTNDGALEVKAGHS